MKKRIYICSLVLAVALSCNACSGNSGNTDNSGNNAAEATQIPVAKEITCEDLTMTLTSDYIENESDSYTLCYSNANSICIGVRETKEDLAANNINASTLDEYTSIIVSKEGITSEVTAYNDNTRSFTWTKDFNGKEYSFICFATESDNAYWLIQFASLTDSYEDMSDKFYEFYDSVRF